MIPNTKPELGREEFEAVEKVMASGWLGRGKECEAFEEEFANYIGYQDPNYPVKTTPYCLFTKDCTNALKMAYRYLKEEGYDGITYPDNTYNATYAAAEMVGLKAIPNSKMLLDGVDGKYGIVVVHFGGVKNITPCMVEDSAHRIEKNDPLIGKIRVYSFHPNKNMTTGGGGMIVTYDKKLYDKFKLWIEDGVERSKYGRFDYTVKEFAGGYEGFDLNAAIGRVQLKKLPEFNFKRNALVERYNYAFGTDWEGNHIYPLDLKTPEKVRESIIELEKRGVSCKWHYPGSTLMTLPLYPSLSIKDQDYVIKEVKTVCRV